MDPIITASLVQGICAIIATVIAAVTASLIGKKFSNYKKLEEKLGIAQNDIEFLLAVEAEHCEIHKESSNSSKKNTIRDHVRNNSLLAWSGKNTPGRLKTR